jgi:hypothetical protein
VDGKSVAIVKLVVTANLCHNYEGNEGLKVYTYLISQRVYYKEKV